MRLRLLRSDAAQPSDQLVEPQVNKPDEVVLTLLARLGQAEISEATRNELIAFLVQTDDGPNPNLFRDDEGFRNDKTRQLIGLILSLPESHAC